MRFAFGRRTELKDAAASAAMREYGSPSGVLRVDSQHDLARLSQPMRRMLRDEFDIGASSNRYCPLQFEDGTVAIATLESYQDSDQVDELERMVLRRQYRLADPARLVMPATLLLALVRGQITAATLRSRQGRLIADRSSMADAFHDMVVWGVENDASDLHLNVCTSSTESEIRYTIDGRYIAPQRFARMPTVTLMEILAVAWMDIQGGNGAVFDPMLEQQGRLYMEVHGRPIMLRWASLATDSGASVCLRILRLDARVEAGFDDLGYLPDQVAMLDRARGSEGGAIVLAGVVGSGKSTTIAALMGMIPRTRKVVTLEDPVEYLIPGALQNTVTRSLDEARHDVFDAKLKTVKRSAMTDLLVGEIRDRETGRAFVDLAGSGSSLYTTVHAGSAMLIPDRLASDFIGVSRDFLATPGILKLLVYQALLPLLCRQCSVTAECLPEAAPAEGWDAYLARFSALYGVGTESLRFRNPAGCPACRARTLPELYGLAGRTVVAEMIEPGADDVFLENLRRGNNVDQRRYLAAARSTGYDDADMCGKTAMECAIYKALQGLIDPRDIEQRFKAYVTVALERGNG